jgi:hypothetical protein
MSTNAASSGPLGLSLKAWGQSSAAGAKLKSLGVTSITRTALGTYSVVFSSAMATATYIVKINALLGDATFLGNCVVTAKTAAGFSILSYGYQNSPVDIDWHFEAYE